MKVPRLRTVETAAVYIKKCDPCTVATRNIIWRLIKNGYLSIHAVGNKHVINLDELLDFFHVKEDGQ